MRRLRLAAVQLDYQPVTRTEQGYWLLQEPILGQPAQTDPPGDEAVLHLLRDHHVKLKGVCDKAMRDASAGYIGNLLTKLRSILTYCYKNKVDLVLFPEYSVPVATIEALQTFSKHMMVVAGIGYITRPDIEALRGLNIDVQDIGQANNVALIFAPEANYLVAKKHVVGNEIMLPGKGPRTESLTLPQGTFTFTVAICRDFLAETSQVAQCAPDIILVPGLSSNTSEFVSQTPRDYVRVFANHASFGGTYFGMANLRGGRFSNKNGTLPLPAGIEGIVIIDWDYEHRWQVKPTPIHATLQHRLYARANLVYEGRDSAVAQTIARLTDIPSQDLRTDDLVEFARELRPAIEQVGSRYQLLQEAIAELDANSDVLAIEELRALSRHCVLPATVFSNAEWRYTQAKSIAARLKHLQDEIPDKVAVPFSRYETAARTLAKDVRQGLLDKRHKGPTVSEAKDDVDRPQLVIFARLGSYGEGAVRSLHRQLTLLRTIATLKHEHLTLRYRLATIRDKTHILFAVFEVSCITRNHTRTEIESLRQGLGQLIHIAYTGAYSMQYTVDEIAQIDAMQSVRDSAPWWIELRPAIDQNGKIVPFRGNADWGVIIDLLRSLDVETALDLECTAAAEISDELMTTAGDETARSHEPEVIEGSQEAGRIFRDMYRSDEHELNRLSLRFLLSGKEPLPDAVVEAVAIELAGTGAYEIVTNDTIGRETPADRQQTLVLKPSAALRLFHPPMGGAYRTVGQARDDLDLLTNETHFCPTGTHLGTARIRQVRSDEDVDVRLEEADRLRHLYIVGKTGSGKTNLLKYMAAQDVLVRGRGVTIIDPHGDLIDHVLTEIPEYRVGEVTLVDLARTDALPILNPLDLDRNNHTIRDRTIQELVLLLRTRIFHQFTGPRFDEMVRLVFQTMLDKGYPVSASFVEVPRLLMDEELQEALADLLTDDELIRRWKFQTRLKSDPEYGGFIHYIISKFDELARDSTIRRVLGYGNSTIDIERIVKDAGILLVRIPEAEIGKQAADFIGSLILLQLRMAIIRRRKFGSLQQYHFVYVDEFQNFANTDFHTLVAEARKFNIGFALANQNLEQLRDFRTYTGVHEERLITAIFGNVANLVAFSVGSFDARFLSEQFGLSAKEVLRIGHHEAIAKILVKGHETSPFTLRPPKATRYESPAILEAIETRMREECWVDATTIEQDISGRINRVMEEARSKRDNVELIRRPSQFGDNW